MTNNSPNIKLIPEQTCSHRIIQNNNLIKIKNKPEFGKICEFLPSTNCGHYHGTYSYEKYRQIIDHNLNSSIPFVCMLWFDKEINVSVIYNKPTLIIEIFKGKKYYKEGDHPNWIYGKSYAYKQSTKYNVGWHRETGVAIYFDIKKEYRYILHNIKYSKHDYFLLIL